MLGAGAIVEQNALRGVQMLIARATDIGVPSVPRFGAGHRSNLLSRRDLSEPWAFAPISMARSAPWGRQRRTMPRQVRNLGALTRICSHNAALAGSIKRASPRLRSIVQLAYRMGRGHMLRNGCVPSVKRRLQIAVAQSSRERPGEPRALDAVQSLPDGRGRDAKATGDLPRRNSR